MWHRRFGWRLLGVLCAGVMVSTAAWAGNYSPVIVVPRNMRYYSVGCGDVDYDYYLTVADLVKMVNWLNGLAEPTYEEVLRGDMNFNGRLDREDLNKIRDAILRATGKTDQSQLTSSDRTYKVYKVYIPGDANGDSRSTPDINDRIALSNYLNNSGSVNVYGADCNRDGKIDIADETLLLDVILGTKQCAQP